MKNLFRIISSIALMSFFSNQSSVLACSKDCTSKTISCFTLNWNAKVHHDIFHSLRSKKIVFGNKVFKFVGFQNFYRYPMPTYFCSESGIFLDLYTKDMINWEFMIKNASGDKIYYLTGFKRSHFTNNGIIKNTEGRTLFTVKTKT